MNASDFLLRLVWAGVFILPAAAFLIARRLTWSRQPALILMLLSESFVGVLQQTSLMQRDWAILIHLVVGFLVIAEDARLRRIPISGKNQAVIAAASICACAFRAGSQPWTMDYRFSLFRCDTRIVLAVLALAIWAYRWKFPCLEHPTQSRRTKAYSAGVAIWFVTEAIQASFVRGGIGRKLIDPAHPAAGMLAYTPERWTWIGIITCVAFLAAVIGTAVAMTLTVKPRRHAAKTADAWMAAKQAA